jgi:hypothetical protein
MRKSLLAAAILLVVSLPALDASAGRPGARPAPGSRAERNPPGARVKHHSKAAASRRSGGALSRGTEAPLRRVKRLNKGRVLGHLGPAGVGATLGSNWGLKGAVGWGIAYWVTGRLLVDTKKGSDWGDAEEGR